MKDVSIERAVLAGLVTYGSTTYLDVADIINADSFTDISNQLIYKAIENILQDNSVERIDQASVFTVAKKVGYDKLFEKKSEIDHLRGIFNFAINKDNVRKFAIKLKKLQIARELDKQLEIAKENLSNVTGDEKIDEIVSLAENPVFEYGTKLAGANKEGPQKLASFIDDYIDYLICNPNTSCGISSGFPLYDKSIGGGFRRKTVNLIGARPKTGKTVFADNVALHVAWKLGIPVLMLDTEMSKEDHINRMLANISRVKIDDIENGAFVCNEVWSRQIDDARNILKSIPYHYQSVAGMPFEEMIAMMRRWVIKEVGVTDGRTNDCLIVYDYLKLMSSDGISKNLQEYQVLGFQITELHNFTVKYDVPCLGFIQLNRDGIEKEGTDVASGSDRIIWLCSNFSIFKVKDKDEIAEDKTHCKTTFNRKLVPIVCRHGAGLEDGDYINVNMKGEFALLTEGITRNELYELKPKNDGFAVDDDEQQF